MQDMRWLDHLPDGTLESGVELANRLYWDISWGQCGQQWCVWVGGVEQHLLLRTNTREALDAFLYGLGLAYAVLPEDTFDHVVYWVKRWGAPEDITPEERARFGGAARSPESWTNIGKGSGTLCRCSRRDERSPWLREILP